MTSSSPIKITTVLKRDGWRFVSSVLVMTAPVYGFLLLYRLSTGDYRQGDEAILLQAPSPATFLLPLLLAVRLLGFRSWQWLLAAGGSALVAGWLPPSLASSLLPNSYLSLALLLVVVTVAKRLIGNYIQLRYGAASAAPYSKPGLGLLLTVLVVCLALLLPAELWQGLAVLAQ